MVLRMAPGRQPWIRSATSSSTTTISSRPPLDDAPEWCYEFAPGRQPWISSATSSSTTTIPSRTGSTGSGSMCGNRSATSSSTTTISPGAPQRGRGRGVLVPAGTRAPARFSRRTRPSGMYRHRQAGGWFAIRQSNASSSHVEAWINYSRLAFLDLVIDLDVFGIPCWIQVGQRMDSALGLD